MSTALAPRAVPLARIRLERVRVRGLDAPPAPPVFHVFEELSRRTLQQRPDAAARTSARA